MQPCRADDHACADFEFFFDPKPTRARKKPFCSPYSLAYLTSSFVHALVKGRGYFIYGAWFRPEILFSKME